MLKWYKKVVFENYANFNGRARRSEYWYYTLMNLIVAIVAIMIDGGLGTNFAPLPYGWVYAIYALAVFLPGLAVAVRRLHDVGKSGWFLFIALIPLVGAIWLIVLFFTEGNRGENQYGSDPKAIEGFEAA
ncbi:DUF805 domain-containing protein [Flavobacterium terrisoli]|uniref:DUF805 domain-containing protein n=1 Tax=Flavobacterium terrisoli TaxID=3242195 RepID=UPI002542FCC7|nr:DUF805 domain-containing protein [Flavobacterium buctense]